MAWWRIRKEPLLVLDAFACSASLGSSHRVYYAPCSVQSPWIIASPGCHVATVTGMLVSTSGRQLSTLSWTIITCMSSWWRTSRGRKHPNPCCMAQWSLERIIIKWRWSPGITGSMMDAPLALRDSFKYLPLYIWTLGWVESSKVEVFQYVHLKLSAIHKFKNFL